RVQRSRRAFFQLGPVGCRPLGNGLLSALAGTARRLVRTPLAASEPAPDARGTIGKAKVACKEGGNPLEGPGVITPAMGARPLASHPQQGWAWRGREFRLAARMPVGGEPRLPRLRSRIPPATDRTGRRFDHARHLADAPADV